MKNSFQRSHQQRLHRYQRQPSNCLEEMVHPERFERPAPRFVVWCSIQLSYGCNKAGINGHDGGMQERNVRKSQPF